MKRFKKILFAAPDHVTPEDKSFQRVMHLAAVNSASLTVVRVLSERRANAEGSNALIVKGLRAELDDLVDAAKAKGIQADSRQLFGVEFIKLIQLVIKEKFDLAITHLEKAHGVKEWIFGGTAIRLLRKCPCPVWVMKPGPDAIYDNILAAVDVMDQAEDSLNHSILKLATSLSEVEKANLHILHSWEVFGQPLMSQGRFRLPEEEFNKVLSEEEAVRRKAMDNLLGDFNLSTEDPNVYLPNGRVEHNLPRLVAKKSIDVVVMGTLCRLGLNGFIIGNTAEKILEQIQCSVLTIKPEGFVSPVK